VILRYFNVFGRAGTRTQVRSGGAQSSSPRHSRDARRSMATAPCRAASPKSTTWSRFERTRGAVAVTSPLPQRGLQGALRPSESCSGDRGPPSGGHRPRHLAGRRGPATSSSQADITQARAGLQWSALFRRREHPRAHGGVVHDAPGVRAPPPRPPTRPPMRAPGSPTALQTGPGPAGAATGRRRGGAETGRLPRRPSGRASLRAVRTISRDLTSGTFASGHRDPAQATFIGTRSACRDLDAADRDGPAATTLAGVC
jgi:hypothetical protein